jgi:methionyl-tRNA formyltransferase
MSIQKLKIGLISSSDFCIPIADKLLQINGKKFGEVLNLETQYGDFRIVNETNYQCYQSQINELKDLQLVLCIVASQPGQIIKSKVVPNHISNWASKNNIPLWNPENINKESNEIFDKLDIAITASFGQLISNSLLQKPRYGYINWHPSLLPKYRGPTPMQSTIANQEKNYGLSWITMTKKMDAGKILLQLDKQVGVNIDFNQMAQELGNLGAETLCTAILHQILNTGTEQNHEIATFCSKVDRENQLVNPQLHTASEIKSHQLAYIKYPGTVIQEPYFGGKIKILECDILELDKESSSSILKFGNLNVIKVGKKQIVFINCKNDTLLRINKITNAQGKQIDLSGYQFKN